MCVCVCWSVCWCWCIFFSHLVVFFMVFPEFSHKFLLLSHDRGLKGIFHFPVLFYRFLQAPFSPSLSLSLCNFLAFLFTTPLLTLPYVSTFLKTIPIPQTFLLFKTIFQHSLMKILGQNSIVFLLEIDLFLFPLKYNGKSLGRVEIIFTNFSHIERSVWKNFPFIRIAAAENMRTRNLSFWQHSVTIWRSQRAPTKN